MFASKGWLLGSIVFAFLVLLRFYGDAWLVPWHDEVVLVRLGQNIAEGRGFRNDLVDDILTGAGERTYWQMPVYPFAVSLWGKLFGFELNSVRWFSRLIGLVSLLLLFALALRSQLPTWASLLAILWTASDLGFQFANNFARPDALTGCLLLSIALFLACLPQSSWANSFALGTLAAIAVFTHPVALPCWVASGVIVAWRAGWRKTLAFALPFLVGVASWLFYAAQAWEMFCAQMSAHIAHKRVSLSDYLGLLLGSTFWGVRPYLGIPTNSMVWSIPLLACFWIGWREKWVLPRWLILFLTALYFAVTTGAEAWYPSVFVPFGYLLLAALLTFFVHKASQKSLRYAFLAFALGWWGWQVSVVARHVKAVPLIRQEVTAFANELVKILPKGSVILVGSFSPDPTFSLLRQRPDVRVYQLMPARMVNRSALRQLRSQLTHLLVLQEALKDPLLWGKEVKRWHFAFGGLSQPPRKGITVLLLASQ